MHGIEHALMYTTYIHVQCKHTHDPAFPPAYLKQGGPPGLTLELQGKFTRV